jgi:hypothetical protein
MTAEKPTRTRMGKRTKRPVATDAAPSPEGKRHLVDFDPWALLSAGLMEGAEDKPAERRRTKRK